MKLYNTLSRKLETFKPHDPENVKVYSCGPTVYDYAHVGNVTSFIYWDLLVRALRAEGYGVDRVMVLTDVGHLTSDADEGEDKLEKGARREGKTVWEVAEYYTKNFLSSFEKLNLFPPRKFCKATDYIEEDQELVQILLDKGYAYETVDGIYYDTAKFERYADFARLDLANIKAGARVEFSEEKHNPSDFALWKFIKPGEKHAMRWDFLGHPGYPGWHIECSSIIHKELGETIDIHTGGIDHIPVHHTNEIAQSEAAFEKKLARFWLHNNFITIDGQKISKSLGNIYRLEDLAERGFSAMDFKLWVLQGHYQSARNFSFEDLTSAKNRYLHWRNRIARLYQMGEDSGLVSGDDVAYGGLTGGDNVADGGLTGGVSDDGSASGGDVTSVTNEILALVANNLNSAEAFSLIDNSELDLEAWRFVDELFGLNLIKNSPDITEEQYGLLEKRALARVEKDYDTSDRIRVELEKQGITVLDTPSGQIWQYLA